MAILRERLRPPTQAELAIGRGEPSGAGGLWRVLDIHAPPRMRIYYADEVVEVRSAKGWRAAPGEGVVAITGRGFIAKNADEYLLRGGDPKLGLYVEDEVYERVIEAAVHG